MERLGACLATWRRVGRTMAGKQWFRGPERRTMGRMRYAGSPSWLMRIHCPLGLLIGLYARDAAGLRPATAVDVPRLEPAVELRADLAPLAVPAASEQWARWWEGELARQEGVEHGFFAPDARFGDGQELDALVRARLDDARRWSGERGHEEAEAHRDGSYPDEENGLVRAVEAEIGRKARPFELEVIELPVAGRFGRRLSEGLVLVSRALRADPEAYRDWLTPVLRDLA
ncbi:conserved hypothetical protein [Actinacidiphila cocklensis]|uniref:Uncharacterized protein n=2 Tax=Actinacidiphila cocklensis TaxID=887465 RepID=A0A9W4GUP0_9ACTN|nr:conserved hypothetical protein [Actinacidiphila cocklensis]